MTLLEFFEKVGAVEGFHAHTHIFCNEGLMYVNIVRLIKIGPRVCERGFCFLTLSAIQRNSWEKLKFLFEL